jgi:hypothetical protein
MKKCSLTSIGVPVALRRALAGVVLLLISNFSATAAERSATYISVEGGPVWQSRNDQAIPGTTGTRFSLSAIDRGPFGAYRAYLGRSWGQHEIRVLYAPLSLDLNTSFGAPVSFNGRTFAAGTPTSAFYKFNSYRMTYTYFFSSGGEWTFGLGFTAKIRDAEVRLSQGEQIESKKNLGFVPLLNLRVGRSLGESWGLRLDLDGLAAPQGRAFDAALFVERKISGSPFAGFFGYRTLEGGASNEQVFNFAWLHYLTFGARAEF